MGALGSGILGLARFEETCDPKVDQVNMPVWTAHDIARLQIAENNRGSLVVQITQHIAQFPRDLQRFRQWQSPVWYTRQVLLQRFALNKAHNQIPVTGLLKVIMDTRQV